MKCRAFIFFLIAALLLCAGCSSMGKKEEMPTTITVWHVYGGQTDSPLNDLIEQFNQTVGKDRQINVQVTSVSNTNTIHELVLAAANGEPGAPELPDLFVSYGVGTIRLKKVVNTEETTTITVQVYISETYLPQGRKPHTRKYKRTLVLQRARYPQRRKQDGKLFTERECPSCGANFVPDENHCCSFCGYSFQADSAKWVVQTGQV